MKTKQQILENAARLQGIPDLIWIEMDQCMKYQNAPVHGSWYYAPDADDGDSRRLEVACIDWMCVEKAKSFGRVAIMAAWNTLTDVRTKTDVPDRPGRYRAAVLALADAIGEVMGGEDAVQP